jgi:hypothetical protein
VTWGMPSRARRRGFQMASTEPLKWSPIKVAIGQHAR